MGTVIDINSKRPRLVVDSTTGRVSGRPAAPSAEDFGNRLTRIRASLDRINRLMAELKRPSNPLVEFPDYDY